ADVRTAAPPARRTRRTASAAPRAAGAVDGDDERFRGRGGGGGDARSRRHSPVRGVAGGATMIDIRDHPEGCVLPVRAQPGARKAGVLGEQGGALKVAVTGPPEDGRANKALVEALREALDLKRSQVELLSGAASRDKRFLVRGLDADELAR